MERLSPLEKILSPLHRVDTGLIFPGALFVLLATECPDRTRRQVSVADHTAKFVQVIAALDDVCSALRKHSVTVSMLLSSKTVDHQEGVGERRVVRGAPTH